MLCWVDVCNEGWLVGRYGWRHSCVLRREDIRDENWQSCWELGSQGDGLNVCEMDGGDDGEMGWLVG